MRKIIHIESSRVESNGEHYLPFHAGREFDYTRDSMKVHFQQDKGRSKARWTLRAIRIENYQLHEAMAASSAKDFVEHAGSKASTQLFWELPYEI